MLFHEMEFVFMLVNIVTMITAGACSITDCDMWLKALKKDLELDILSHIRSQDRGGTYRLMSRNSLVSTDLTVWLS